MKKHIYSLTCAALLAAGCSSDDNIVNPSDGSTSAETVSVTATFSSETRTYSTDGKKSLWETTDNIYIGDNVSVAEFVQKELKDGGAKAVFTGSKVLTDNMYAVYGGELSAGSTLPTFGSDKSFSGISIPDQWKYVKNSNCKNVLLMGKVSLSATSNEVQFKHAGAVLYVDLGNGASSFKAIKVTSGASTTNTTAIKISGAATITWDETNGPKYTCADNGGETITIEASGSNCFETGTKVVVPIPAATYGSLKIDGSVDGTNFNTAILSISDYVIERNKSYKVTYSNIPATEVTDVTTLQTLLNKSEGCSVILKNDISLSSTEQTFTISGNNSTVVDLNRKTLTAAKSSENKVSLALNVGENAKSSAENTPASQKFILRNGNVVIDSYATTVELTITNACQIYLENVNFTVPTTSNNTYKIILKINNELLDSAGIAFTPTGHMIYFNYSNCKVNDNPMTYTPFFLNKDYTGGIIARSHGLTLEIVVNPS